RAGCATRAATPTRHVAAPDARGSPCGSCAAANSGRPCRTSPARRTWRSEMHGRPDLLVGSEDDFAVGQLEVAARDGENQFPPLGLVELAALHAVAHGG